MASPSEIRFDELDRDYQVFSRNLDEIRGKRDLDALARAGWNRQSVRRLLALAANKNGDVLNLMRRRHTALKSFAKRLMTLSVDAKRILKDPLSRVQGWARLHGHLSVIGMPETMTWHDEVGLFTVPVGMEWWAKQLNREAKAFGRYLRAFGRVDSDVVLLLVRCWMFDTKIKKPEGRIRFQLDHLDTLARLIADAFECVGKHEKANKVSADGLRQIFKRHGRRMILLWLKFSEPPPPAAPLQSPPIQGLATLGRIGESLVSSLPMDKSNP